MATATSTEIVILKLRQEVDGPAAQALGALGRLEAQIGREERALGRLEGGLAQASARLRQMASGTVDPKAVAAFERQRLAVADLERELEAARSRLDGVIGAKADPRAIESVARSVDALTSKLDIARSKMHALQAGAAARPVSSDAYKKQAAEVEKLSDAVASKRDHIADMGSKLGKMKAPEGNGLKELSDAIRQNGLDAGVASGSIGRLVSTFAKMGPEIGLIVVALAALTASIAAVYSVIAKGITAVGEMRDEFIRLKGEVANLNIGWMGFFRGATVNATMLQAAIDKVSPSSALPRDKIEAYAIQLAKARISAEALPKALRAMSAAGSVSDAVAQKFLGMATAAKFLGMATAAKSPGMAAAAKSPGMATAAKFPGMDAAAQSIDKVSDTFIKKFGPIAEQKALSLTVQFQKLREEIAYMFSGADIDAFLVGIQSIFGLFDRNTAAAKGMREAIQSVVEHGINLFLRLEIAIMKSYIWLRQHDAMWKLLKDAVKGLGYAMLFFGAVALVALGAIAVGIALALSPLIAMGVALSKLVEHWDSVKLAAEAFLRLLVGDALVDTDKTFIGKFIDWIKSIDFLEIGANIIGGIVSGIKSTVGSLYSALTDAVFGSVEAAKNAARIHSPSELTAKLIGEPLVMGATIGIERKSGALDAVMSSTVESSVSSARPVTVGGRVDPVSSLMPAASYKQEPAPDARAPITFHGCTFGDGLTEEKLTSWLLRALEGQT